MHTEQKAALLEGKRRRIGTLVQPVVPQQTARKKMTITNVEGARLKGGFNHYKYLIPFDTVGLKEEAMQPNKSDNVPFTR